MRPAVSLAWKPIQPFLFCDQSSIMVVQGFPFLILRCFEAPSCTSFLPCFINILKYLKGILLQLELSALILTGVGRTYGHPDTHTDSHISPCVCPPSSSSALGFSHFQCENTGYPLPFIPARPSQSPRFPTKPFPHTYYKAPVTLQSDSHPSINGT